LNALPLIHLVMFRPYAVVFREHSSRGLGLLLSFEHARRRLPNTCGICAI
jgi:hypothetical protein